MKLLLTAAPLFRRVTSVFLPALALAATLFCPPSASAATAPQPFTVSSPTGLNFYTYNWTPLTTTGGNYLLDPALDQQTGQVADDFVSAASTPGFFMRYGLINGVESVAFRVVLNKLTTDNKGNPDFIGQVSIGFDSTGDGALDLVLTTIGKNSTNGINWQAPGTGANVSPNTTTLGTPTLISAFTATNFDYRVADSTIYPGWTQIGPAPDAVLTFSISFASLNSALAAVGKPAVTADSMLRFIAFTSTQTNSINQDVYGTTGISTAVRFDAGGGFTEFTDLTGRPIPEPSTLISLGAFLAAALGVKRLRRSRRPSAAPAAS